MYDVVDKVVIIATISNSTFLSNTNLLVKKYINKARFKMHPKAPGSHAKPEFLIL
jgi:hypothetical protein